MQKLGRIELEFRTTTWRCSPGIAAFSDKIFDPQWEFPPKQSLNETQTGHDGMYLVTPERVMDYVERYKPRCLRVSAASGRQFDLDYINFKIAKGATYERVLIIATGPITQFLQKGTALEPGPAAAFYVAVTRAQRSVAIVLHKAGKSDIPRWAP
jgi:hypothetical protein